MSTLRVSTVVLCALTASAHADEGATEEDPEHEYAAAGNVEAGGSAGVSWEEDLLEVTASLSFGYFLWDRFEISASLSVDYTRERDEGVTTTTKTVSLIAEPSYHYPMADKLHLLGGLGVGGGYDGSHGEFEIVPRVGINIEVGDSSVVTPSLSVPILIGRGHGSSNNDIGASLGVDFEVGITTLF